MSERPIRIVILGGSATGKTSLASRLSVNLVHEVHYLTRKQTNWLFSFKPTSSLARFILDRKSHARLKARTREVPQPLIRSPEVTTNVLLSPFIYDVIMQEYKHARDHKMKDASELKQDNYIYQYLDTHDDLNKKNTNMLTNTYGNIASDRHRKNSIPRTDVDEHNLPNFKKFGYLPPSFSDISIDIIDTPGFNPDMVVPFLEVSLFSNLGKPILRGLASEPRKPVSTQPILVASGTAELNGRVDGYFLVYSVVPELNKVDSLPSYEDVDDVDNISAVQTVPSNSSQASSSNKWSDFDDGGFGLLTTIRNCFLDAWKEYRNYQKLTKDSAETDIYNVMQSLKQMWKSEVHTKEKEKRKLINSLKDINLAPDDPDSPPPIILVGTHIGHELASPVLLQWGKDLALQWNCGFVGIDSMLDENVDVALSMLLREIVERDAVVCKKQAKKSTLGKLL